MPRARRLASTVVAAALAVSGLAACNRAPDVAVYFGNAKGVTEDQVQKIWDGSFAKLNPDAEGKKTMPVSRLDIVSLLAETAAMKEVGRMQSFTAGPVDGAQLAQQLNMAQDAPLVGVISEFRGWVTAAQQKVTPDEATEADLRDIWARLDATGGLNKSFEEFASTISAEDKQALGSRLGLRNDITAAVKNLKITYNPRYPAPVLPLLEGTGPDNNPLPLVVVTFGTSEAGSAPVKDLA